MKKKSKPSSKIPNRPYWLERAWPGPVQICFAHNEETWNAILKDKGLPREPYPTHDGLCTTFTRDAEIDCVVTVGKPDNLRQLIGILAHEATHCYQKIKDWMREKEPGIEFEAYTVGSITQGLAACYFKTRGVPSAKIED